MQPRAPTERPSLYFLATRIVLTENCRAWDVWLFFRSRRMYRRSIVALLVAVLTLSPALVNHAQAQTFAYYYAAIAYSPSTGQYGYSYAQPSLDAASSVALSRCNASDARIMTWSRNGWCSLALSHQNRNAYGIGYSPNATMAMGYALNGVSSISGDGYIAVIVNSGSP